MDIWMQYGDYCGNMKLSICGNFEYPKFVSAEEFELISCLLISSNKSCISTNQREA